MLGFVGTSYALFAVVWGLMCLVASALVTDTMLRGAPTAATIDVDPSTESSAAEA